MKSFVLASCFVLAAISTATAQVIDDDLDQFFVTIATAAKQVPSLATAATVITAADIRKPSINNGAIPFDLPLAERNFYFQLSYKL